MENTTLWPTGMRSFAKFVHSRGMKLGVYTGAAVHGCCNGELGSKGYEDIDMQTFAEWGADAVAVDFCGAGDAKYRVRDEYQKYADAIAKSSNPNMKLNIFNLGFGRAWTWAPQVGASMFRVTADIGNSWYTQAKGIHEGVMQVVDVMRNIPDLDKHTGTATGSYPMYGQLAVGVRPGRPGPAETGLTLT